MELLTQPFPLGLMLGLMCGLVIVLVGWVDAWGRRRSLVKDNQHLREHLRTMMAITEKGYQDAIQEIDQLKKQNENMRISFAALKNRPDRSELCTLYRYDKAIHIMYATAPGFAPAWEAAMQEADTEMGKMDTGILAWVRKIIRPSLSADSLRSINPEGRSNPSVGILPKDEKSEA
jgi:hypothetical protein